MNPDFLDLLRALLARDARFLIVGAYAMAIHGRPRATGDLDVWIEPSQENAPRVMEALRAFGAPLFDLSEADLATEGVVFQMGLPPRRIDILTRASGLTFAAARDRAIQVKLGDVTCPVISLDDQITNKRATGRDQDIVDARELAAIRDRHRGRLG